MTTEYELGKDEAVLGRTLGDLEKYGAEGTAFIGKVVMSSGERPALGRKVKIDIAKPHVILVCGKRGGGKSYTMGVLAEEFALQPETIKQRISVLIIDTVGIFWSLKLPNTLQEKELAKWGLKPQGVDVRLLVPKGKLDYYLDIGMPVDGVFTIRTGDMDYPEWMEFLT